MVEAHATLPRTVGAGSTMPSTRHANESQQTSVQQQTQAYGVHLVGSVPLDSTEAVFRYVCKALPGRLRRMTDGETGKRINFMDFQRELFPPHMVYRFSGPPAQVPQDEVGATIASLPTLQTGYDDAAIASYTVFCKLRTEGVIPPGVRFQVSLPTVANVVAAIEAAYQAAIEPVYEEALLRALDRIQAEIPPHDLAVQWDTAVEFAMLEGLAFFPPWFSPTHSGIIDRLVRLSSRVNTGVELGFHLCYGDIGHRHFVEPKDTGVIVSVISALLQQVQRPINWFHLPVPKDRDDVPYFTPLKGLDLGQTQLFLGLIHPHDQQGTIRRINAAGEAEVGKFGVATECGMGRCPIEELPSIFDIKGVVSAPYQ